MTFTAKAALVDDPLLAADWHPVRNDDLDPSVVGARTSRVVWWRCAMCGTEVLESPLHRARRWVRDVPAAGGTRSPGLGRPVGGGVAPDPQR